METCHERSLDGTLRCERLYLPLTLCPLTSVIDFG